MSFDEKWLIRATSSTVVLSPTRDAMRSSRRWGATFEGYLSLASIAMLYLTRVLQARLYEPFDAAVNTTLWVLA